MSKYICAALLASALANNDNVHSRSVTEDDKPFQNEGEVLKNSKPHDSAALEVRGGASILKANAGASVPADELDEKEDLFKGEPKVLAKKNMQKSPEFIELMADEMKRKSQTSGGGSDEWQRTFYAQWLRMKKNPETTWQEEFNNNEDFIEHKQGTLIGGMSIAYWDGHDVQDFVIGKSSDVTIDAQSEKLKCETSDAQLEELKKTKEQLPDTDDVTFIKPTSIFGYASLSKFIGAAIALNTFEQLDQAIQEHKIPKSFEIKLTDKVNDIFNKYGANPKALLTDFDDKNKWADQVQVHQLLNHRALSNGGFGFAEEITELSMTEWMDDYMPRLETLEKGIIKMQEKMVKPWGMEGTFDYKWTDVRKKPGSSWDYSNGGYECLLYIVELVHAKLGNGYHPYEFSSKFSEEFGFEKNVLFANGLLSKIDSQQDDWHVNTAVGHTPDGTQWHPSFLSSFAGGGAGTARNYLNFLRGFYRSLKGKNDGDSVISQKAAETMLTLNSGIMIFKLSENTVIWHGGDGAGSKNFYFFCIDGPDEGKGFVMLSNQHANPAVTAFGAAEVARFLGWHGFASTDFQDQRFRDSKPFATILDSGNSFANPNYNEYFLNPKLFPSPYFDDANLNGDYKYSNFYNARVEGWFRNEPKQTGLFKNEPQPLKSEDEETGLLKGEN